MFIDHKNFKLGQICHKNLQGQTNRCEHFLLLFSSIIQVSDISFATQGLCHLKYGLSYRQIRFCQRNEAIMPFIRFGANLALEECKNQFKNRHWNCTLFHDQKLIGNILDSGTNTS